MKRLLLAIAVAVLAASCSTMNPTKRVVLTSFSDYRPYAEAGFLISPSSYTYAFESVGEIDIFITPAKVVVDKPSMYNGAVMKVLDYEEIEYAEMVEMAVNQAKEKGADALVNFSISKGRTEAQPGIPSQPYYHIKGFCIKRK